VDDAAAVIRVDGEILDRVTADDEIQKGHVRHAALAARGKCGIACWQSGGSQSCTTSVPPTWLSRTRCVMRTKMISPAARGKRLRKSVPKPGRYDLALLTGDDEIARQPLLIGPADVLRGDLAGAA